MILAAFLDGPGRISVRPHTLPPPGDAEVVVAVEACAVCVTDLRAWKRGSRRAQAGLTGHEIAGVVTELGAGVDGLAVGDRVCVEPNLAVCCGACAFCQDGKTYLCADRRELPAWGFSEAMVVPAQAAIGVPAPVPTAVAALTEPLACAVRALRGSRVASDGARYLDGRDVAIIGAGPLGLLALVAARRAGARRVLVAVRHDHQRELVVRMGGEPVGEDLAQLADAGPAVVLIAAGGDAELLAGVLRVVRVGGEVVVLGLLDRPQTIDARRAVLRGLQITFSISHGGWGEDSDFAAALDVLRADPAACASILGHRFALADAAAAFARAADRAAPRCRVVIGTELAAENR